MKKVCQHCAPFEARHIEEKLYFFIEIIIFFLERCLRFLCIPEKLNDLVFIYLVRLLMIFRLAKFCKCSVDNIVGVEKQRLIIAAAIERGKFVEQLYLFERPTSTFMVDGKLLDQVPGSDSVKPVYHRLDHKPSFLAQTKRFGLPVPKSRSFVFLKRACKYADQIGYPIVVKPTSGSFSKHAFYPVQDEQELLRVFTIAKQISPSVVVEKYISGDVHMVTLVKGRVVAVCRRMAPSVIGDGTTLLRDLIRRKHRAAEIDQGTLGYIKDIGLNFDMVPECGQEVVFNNKLLAEVGVEVCDLTDSLHFENKQMFERLARELGGILVGFDLIAQDLSNHWQKQEFAFIEANSFPAIEMHCDPDSGQSRDVAAAIWDALEDD